MMRLVRWAIALVLMAAGAANAQEKIEFDSLTPKNFFELARKKATNVEKMYGTLVLPSQASGRLPAMVIAHGSAGVSEDREFRWAERLREIGVASFIVDSFAPRGISQTATDQSKLSNAANLADVLIALRLLAANPRIDPRRIGIIGFSRGGAASIYAALEPYRSGVIDGDTRFALHVALYPSCSSRHQSSRVTGAPMLFLLGGKDDYTPASECQKYVDWFKSRGTEVQAVVYPDAYHMFDGTRNLTYLSKVVTGKDCHTVVDLDRFAVLNGETGENITRTLRSYIRDCSTRGAHIGGDAEAGRRAPRDVIAFVKARFKL